MAPAASFDPEQLLCEAVAGVAVAAYASDVGLSAHVDNRLPERLAGEGPQFLAFLRRGLARTVAALPGGRLGLALWHEPGRGDGELVLEVCAEPAMPAASGGLAAHWLAEPAPLGLVRRAVGGRGRVERLVLAAPCGAAADESIAGRWRESVGGTTLVDARPPLWSAERYRASLAALDVDLSLPGSPAGVLDAMAAARGAGKAVVMVVLGAHGAPRRSIDLARRIREGEAPPTSRLVLAEVTRRVALSPAEFALFDAVSRPAVPWRRLVDLLRDFRLAAAAPGGSEGARPAIPRLSGRRILVAEDVATNQVLLRALLEPTGARVETVTSGDAVCARQEAEPADLIVMDLQMPGMGGIAALRRIRALPGAAARVPVVAVTAHAREADRRAAMAAGMEGFLAKPIVVAEFYALLRRLLEDSPGEEIPNAKPQPGAADGVSGASGATRGGDADAGH